MALYVFSLEQKIEALTLEVERLRKQPRPAGSPTQHRYEVFKSILADLRARTIFPRSQPLGELERALASAKASKSAIHHGYEQGKMIAVANVLINKWPFVSQALERFGEESAE